MKTPSRRGRLVIAVVCVGVLAVAALGYWYVSAQRGPNLPEAGVVADEEEADLAVGPTMQVLTNGQLSLVPRGHPGGPRTVMPVACDRAYAAGGTVVCLSPVDQLAGTRLMVLDSQLHERQSVALTGFPNLARVSPSGRMIAWTVLVGQSHMGGLSPSTGILDTHAGTLTRSLVEFAVVKDGQPYQADDVTFSGVSFADDNRFYASMSTGGRHYLVEGDIAARRVRPVAPDVEVPSLSPDGTRIAFQHTIMGTVPYVPTQGSHSGHRGSEAIRQLSILDMNGLRVTHLSENRSVDDQAIWLDNATVAYSLQRPDGTNDVWAVPADGTGSPRVLIPGASSPAPSQ